MLQHQYPDWIQDRCIDAIENGMSKDVRGLAITCIGHVASAGALRS